MKTHKLGDQAPSRRSALLTDSEYSFNSYTLTRHVRLAMVLATIAAANLSSIGISSASSAQSNAAQPVPTCSQFWRNSGHTDRVRWYHCHSTSSAYTKRVHICGYSGYLHGVSVLQLPDGSWLTGFRHLHDQGGEGCRRR